MTKLNELTIHELRKKLDMGEISGRDIVDSIISQINNTEDKYHAYITIDEEYLRKLVY